ESRFVVRIRPGLRTRCPHQRRAAPVSYRRRCPRTGAGLRIVHLSVARESLHETPRLVDLDTRIEPCVNRAQVAPMSSLRLLPLLFGAFVVAFGSASSAGAPQNNILVSQDSTDTQLAGASGAYSYAPAVSSNGNYVAFQS